jgi:hypothetical protein
MYRLILAILCGDIIMLLYLFKGLMFASPDWISLRLTPVLMAAAEIGALFFKVISVKRLVWNSGSIGNQRFAPYNGADGGHKIQSVYPYGMYILGA